MEIAERLKALARVKPAGAAVVSLYLNTRWADEQQRDRARVFVKNELRRVRREHAGQGLEPDLQWIEGEAEAVTTGPPEADGVALFACHAAGLREAVAVRAPLEDALVVADAPHLLPLAAFAETAPPALVVFVDRESARLVPVTAAGVEEELVLRHDVEGQPRRGGWALLAQSRYERHIEAQRDRHFEAVAETLRHLADAREVARIVLAGEPRTVAAFRTHLAGALDARIAGTVVGTRYEPAADLAKRGAALLRDAEQREASADLEAVLTDAAKGGRAVAGVAPTIEASLRGAVSRLYVLEGFDGEASVCEPCQTLRASADRACPTCGGPTPRVELAEALADRVLAAGGTVEAVAVHPGLAAAGGVAARCRFAL
jgi:peptide subunit release factor 1 (eRF1)